MDKRIILIIISFLGLVGVISLLWWAMTTLTTVRTGVEFIVVPDEIDVLYNNNEFKVDYESVVKFDPGEYELTFSKTDFTNQTKSVEVVENEITSVYILLEPQTNEAAELLSQSVMGSRIERIAGQMVTEGGEQLEEDYPFINDLPIIDRFFSIKTCSSENSIIAICVYLSPNNSFQRERATEAAIEANIDIDRFKLNFIEDNNPH
jgi:hypothetical protein